MFPLSKSWGDMSPHKLAPRTVSLKLAGLHVYIELGTSAYKEIAQCYLKILYEDYG